MTLNVGIFNLMELEFFRCVETEQWESGEQQQSFLEQINPFSHVSGCL